MIPWWEQEANKEFNARKKAKRDKECEAREKGEIPNKDSDAFEEWAGGTSRPKSSRTGD